MNTTATGVTTSVSRRVAAGREQEFLRWTDAGMAMAGTFPGFLGGGWLRAASDPEQYHVVYRFGAGCTADPGTALGWDPLVYVRMCTSEPKGAPRCLPSPVTRSRTSRGCLDSP
ncbi:hypothetical protein ROP_65250 [Rhodococcus opacus B4]|uniref:Uncharacterized protein n=1 Tax=Rhodococcus opacus (strain B4) TaxID=632772 RepID=C1B1S7_RHOOB|nr:hypothetical protein ROP_65250 [Rhodococcus opacus B4]